MQTFFEKLPACLLGMEACGGSHYWAREIAALGHEVRLIPPAYVKPYIKRGKTDAADAEGICEAVVRKTMRFVPVKTTEQQSTTMLMKTRELLVRQETQLINALRAHVYELGIITGKGVGKVSTLISIIRDPEDGRVPPVTRFALVALANQFEALGTELRKLEKAIEAMVKRDLDMQRLATIPGVGPITAASIKALVPDISGFKSARHFAAFMWTCLNQPVRASCARPSASCTSLLLIRADKAPLAWRAQMHSTGTSRSIRPWYRKVESGPVSSTTRAKSRQCLLSHLVRTSGSLATTSRRSTVPSASTTHTCVVLSLTSNPA